MVISSPKMNKKSSYTDKDFEQLVLVGLLQISEFLTDKFKSKITLSNNLSIAKEYTPLYTQKDIAFLLTRKFSGKISGKSYLLFSTQNAKKLCDDKCHDNTISEETYACLKETLKEITNRFLTKFCEGHTPNEFNIEGPLLVHTDFFNSEQMLEIDFFNTNHQKEKLLIRSEFMGPNGLIINYHLIIVRRRY